MTMRYTGSKIQNSLRVILCFFLTQLFLIRNEIDAFSSLPCTSTRPRTRFRQYSSSSLNYADSPNFVRKNVKKKIKKTRKQIQIDLQHQFRSLVEVHSNNHQVNVSKFSNLESNLYNSIWSSQSVSDVYNILNQFLKTAKIIIHQAAGIDTTCSEFSDEQNFNSTLQLIGPNIAAAALRRIIDIRPDLNGRHGYETDVRLARALIPSLLQLVGREVVHSESEKIPENISRSSEIYSFVNLILSTQTILGSSTVIFKSGMTHVSNANVLHSLAKIKLLQRKNGVYSHETTLKPLVKKICVDIRQRHVSSGENSTVKNVNPKLLNEMLCALATFDMKDEAHLLYMIGNRLKQGDATGKLNSQQLTLGLWAYASLERPHLGVLKSFTRRLRKAPVRQNMTGVDITRAIWAVGQSMKHIDLIEQDRHQLDRIKPRGDRFTDEDIASLREDSTTMVYTLTEELIRSKTLNATLGKKKIHTLSMSQVADLLSTFVMFEFEFSHGIFKEFEDHIENNLFSAKLKAPVLARLLWSFQRLKGPANNEKVVNIVRKFVDIVECSNNNVCTPKTMITVLRSVAMILPDHGKSVPELYGLTSTMLKEKKFLKKCNEFECSNFIWAMAMAKYYDKELIRMLSDRMRDDEILSSVTPSSVSRFLWSFTILVESDVEDLEMKEVLFEMFQSLGGVLLSTKLTPVDASSAMWAMAKSTYSLDMGIFDHLSEVLAVDFMLDRATVQQITEALWACGKMISWEDPVREKMEFGEVTPPPYVKSGERFASYLATCRNIMSAKDVSQSIWAVGRMKISDPEIVSPLIMKAMEMAEREEFNSQELANIIWALSKLDSKDANAVSCFTKEIQKSYILDFTTSQEASNILYALGKMGIRDKEVFSCMNSVLMRQLDTATTQTIANALWAHDSVNLVPPRQLFDTWAKEKLDIVGLYLDNQQVEIIQHSKEGKA